ncbi:MAG TPA: glutathione S-transferase family protein [Dongiaceae bacterium]|jgi:glutathione S-transferase|nr:glutathione S-transferase family protein [Dongiaceae bacterium]
MYTLYWSPGSASMAPHGCLEEAGVPYVLKLIDTSKGENQNPDYLALNPKGKVPALALDDGEIVTESAAICMAIADRHPEAGLAPAIGDRRRGQYYAWLMHLSNTLQSAMLEFYYPDRHTTSANGTEAVAAKARETIAGIWQRIDAHLAAEGPYLLGGAFSAPDLFCYMLSTWQECCPDTYARFPALKRLAGLVAARPAIARMIEQNQAA